MVKELVPTFNIFNLRNANRATPMLWIIIVAVIFVVAGLVISFLQILLYLGAFFFAVLIAYYLVWKFAR